MPERTVIILASSLAGGREWLARLREATGNKINSSFTDDFPLANLLPTDFRDVTQTSAFFEMFVINFTRERFDFAVPDVVIVLTPYS